MFFSLIFFNVIRTAYINTIKYSLIIKHLNEGF